LDGAVVEEDLRVDFKDVLVVFGQALETAEHVNYSHYC
jgi:hypothetical protein